MSNFAVNLARLEIFPHTNAERLELAQVGLFRAVVIKGQYKTGDIALYIPESAILPDALIAEIGLSLAGPKHNRVKAIRLRGELSQGIVCLPAALGGVDLEAALANNVDFADDLGISKWIPEVPANMGGEVFAAPRILPWVEIDNIKAHPDIFVPGEMVYGSEKLHGSACLSSLDLSATKPQEAFLVSSKGMGGKRLALVESDDNLYWRALRQHGVEAAMRLLAELLSNQENPVTRLGLFGEVYGAGVQDLTYGINSRNTPGYAVFDAFLERAADAGRWLDQDELRALLTEVGLPMVPELYAGPYDYAALAAVAEGPSVQGAGANIREGVVVRPAHERYSSELGTRLIAKFLSPEYLTRKGENVTEYE
jgi:RNA ligase (TIGR02306 family)